jgi:hypothetical protein
VARRLRPVSAAALTVWAIVGLIVGWLVHRVGESVGGTAPVISWFQPLLLVLVAAIMLGTAWITWRQVQVHGQRIESYRAVNRLVLGRACGLVGALLAGGYLGYAVSWLNLGADPLAHRVLWRALIAALAGAGICAAGIWLEHACRIRDEDESHE